MTPAELGQQLRENTSTLLQLRRATVALALTAAGSMGLITLYQMGILKHLPEPPIPGLNADMVDASPEAYSRFETPDGVLGLGNYAITMGLAAMGGTDRARSQPWIPLALAAKVFFDTTQAVRLFIDQKTKEGAFCPWCLLAAGTTLATIPLIIPEMYTALQHLFRKPRS